MNIKDIPSDQLEDFVNSGGLLRHEKAPSVSSTPGVLGSAQRAQKIVFDPSAPTIRSYCASKGIYYQPCAPNMQSNTPSVVGNTRRVLIRKDAKSHPQNYVAKKYGISQQQVSRIVNSQ